MIEEKIPIKIFGQSYEVIGDPTEALYYNSLARYVEGKMQDIQKGTNIVSSQKIAILAALNIADELLHERENKSATVKTSDKKMDELIKVIDKAMAGEVVDVAARPERPAPPPPPKRSTLPVMDNELVLNFD